QFHRFARFDPAAPRVDAEEYARRVRAVSGHAPWEPSLPPAERVVIPGFASLRAFSAAEEAAVKTGLGSRFWTLVHWTNWRVSMPVPDGHQAVVLDEVLAELAAGRLVQLLVTNWPKQELSHTVVAYGYRGVDDGVELTVWDPNDPAAPGAAGRRFPAERAVVRRNLARILPGAPARELDALVAAVFRHFAICFADLITANRRADIGALVAGIEGMGRLEKAARAGRGLVVLTAHLGNWE